MHDGTDLHDKIAREAYALYQKRGMTEGDHLNDWLLAEKIVVARHVSPPKMESPAVSKEIITKQKRQHKRFAK